MIIKMWTCRYFAEITYIWSHWLVNRAPPDLVLRRWLLDNTLVERRSTSLLSRVCSKSTARCDGRTGLVN